MMLLHCQRKNSGLVGAEKTGVGSQANSMFGAEIRVGTDCSGLDAMLLALKSLKQPFQHCFSSDVSHACRETLRFNYGNGFDMYEDCTNRNVELVPRVHLYHAGFPCQPYSLMGLGQGLEDVRGSPVLGAILAYIKVRAPVTVLLENVKGMAVQHQDALLALCETLWHYGYDVFWKVLNAKDFGVASCPSPCVSCCPGSEDSE